MPFSHHSHSGQFCEGHAKNSLEDIIRTAIGNRMRVFALSEHMPRMAQDFYPEEIEANATEASLIENESAYFKESQRLREKYISEINIPIGFECDWIRPSSLTWIQNSLARFPFDFFVGSVHHVHTIPIDYDTLLYQKARGIAGGTDERLFEDYFDAQLAMLKALNPPVVGHFDLIRLKSDDPERSFQQWPAVWEKILRNLDYVAEYGGILELNSASLRKGMTEPYPKAEICKEFLARNGRFCMSDDSHGIDQVALNYNRMLEFIEQVGISTLHYLEYCSELPSSSNSFDRRFPHTGLRSVSLADLKQLAFWS
ncbi:histidinol-phosphatase [Histoplasma capsulatum var. duboisii H88]|uniref:Histidinol-phosphatase n=2 Tax=Ajellomyces capsulatus TaxID=5037 RepID=F0URT1_AJEC8|nr:histidinol-phosphatase [Histoplasma capsulatum H143]EGC48608.1 histidinol-phosphatase [Histoplasma capsulatum var. duboisii H88]QSS50614.1 histidinol-phosphatase [Histoplasma capsulatum var. duboisii H88]